MQNLLSQGVFDRILALDVLHIIANYGLESAEWRYLRIVDKITDNLLIEKESIVDNELLNHRCTIV
jgi:hypothetical protein